jgi:KDO2-lipid IV(A) lauroyltransferase
LAKISGAVVLPVITRMVGDHYVTRIGEAWTDFPTDDVVADTRRMNAYLETEIMKSPEQYYWLHKRFKTRPRGEPRGLLTLPVYRPVSCEKSALPIRRT